MVEVGYDSSSMGTAEQSTMSIFPFKGFLALCLASVAKLMPDLADRIVPLLEDTAVAVAEQCDGTSNQTVCGSDWGSSKYNNDTSFENTWNAANVFTSKLLAPETSKSGNSTSSGNSKSGDTSKSTKSEKGISKAVIAGAVVAAAAGVALIVAAIVFALRRNQRRIPVPTKEPEEPYSLAQTRRGPAEMAQTRYVPEMYNGMTTELPGRVDASATRYDPHEMDSAAVSELGARGHGSRYELS